MMDHLDLVKGKVPDKYKDEVIQDRYVLRGPPNGQVLGSFNSVQMGLLWKLPNVDETDMLKSVLFDKFVEEKIYFEQNFEKDDKFGYPMKISLYKTLTSPNLHLRAVYVDDDVADDKKGALDFLRSKHQVLSASIVKENGTKFLEDKSTRSYMFAGQRYWEIPSIITEKDFNTAGLLSSDGSLLIRLTFGCKQQLPAQHFTASGSVSQEVENANEDLIEKAKKSKENESECDMDDKTKSVEASISSLALDPLPFQLTSFSKVGKFADGTLHVIDKLAGEETEYPIHRVVLAARSPYFEAAFENSPKVTIDKYSKACMESVLEFVYSNEVTSKDFNLLTQLITASEELQINGLTNKCINGLVDCPIEIPEALTTFKLGMKFNSVVLRVHATQFMNKLKGQIGSHSDELKAFMSETGTEVLFDWLLT